ncbi:uncharacterized protein DS421_13g411360 [Arachis hypogaea]|nr:uncharacterized protein DS421_13g411360 [Arachis hypogaea]
MDDVSILHHLNFITNNSIRMAHMGAALFRTVQGSPVYATKAFLEDAKLEFDRVKGLKDELNARVINLELDLEKEKSQAVMAEADANLAEETAKKHNESYTRTYAEVLELRGRLKTTHMDYADLQSHLVDNVTGAYENLKTQV